MPIHKSLVYGHPCGFHVSAAEKPVKGLQEPNSFSPEKKGGNGGSLFLKMHGHEIYKYTVKTVSEVAKQSLDKAGFTLRDVKKVLIHQANQKMDEAMRKVQ